MELKKALEHVSVKELKARGLSSKQIKGYFKAKGKALRGFKRKVNEIMSEGGVAS